MWVRQRGRVYPLRERIRITIFGSPDYPVFPDSLLSDGNSFTHVETLFEI